MIYRILIGLAFLGAMTASAASQILWGANGHPFYAYPGTSISEQLDYLADLGMKSYRVNISDADKAADLNVLVKQAKARGIDILPVITPGVDLDKSSPKELYDQAFKLAVTLASPLKDDVRVWELGNEMEIYALLRPCETRDNGSKYSCAFGIASGEDPLDYNGSRWAKVSAVLKGLSDGVISVDPTIRKAMGTGGWGHIGAFARMQQDGIKWDISVWHEYGADPEPAFKELTRYGHPIWLTEFNNPYGSQRGEQEQVAGLKKMMARLKELSGVYRLEAAFLYELMDEPYWAPDYEAYMGLVHVVPTHDGGWMSGDPKPAYFGVKQIVRDQYSFPVPPRSCDRTVVDQSESPEVQSVRYSYCTIFGHSPESGDLAAWMQKNKEGGFDALAMTRAMLASDEFRDRYKSFALSDTVYVDLLYRLLLGRPADGYGLLSYVKQLNSGAMSRKEVAFGMVASSEFKGKNPGLFPPAKTSSASRS